MKKRLIIEYRWWRNDRTPIDERHNEALEESAWDRITKAISEGYQSGQLLDCIRMTDDDPEDGIEYTGWWDLKQEEMR